MRRLKKPPLLRYNSSAECGVKISEVGRATTLILLVELVVVFLVGSLSTSCWIFIIKFVPNGAHAMNYLLLAGRRWSPVTGTSRRGSSVRRRSRSIVVVARSIVILIVITSIGVGVYKNEKMIDKRWDFTMEESRMKGTFDNQQSKGSSTIYYHLLRLVVSSTNWQMVMKLTMVGISRTWVRSAWSIVVISLAVGTGSFRHFVDWIWNWERHRLFVIETMRTEEWNGFSILEINRNQSHWNSFFGFGSSNFCKFRRRD